MNILLAVDQSADSTRASQFLRTYSRPDRAVVTIFHVLDAATVPLGHGDTTDHLQQQLARLRQQERQQARSWIGKVHQTFDDAGWQAHTAIKEGVPVVQILRSIDASRIDLTVLGTRGQSALKTFLLGSVSEQVLTHAKSSVLIVRGRPRRNREAGLKVLFAVDDSADARYAATLIGRLGLPRSTHVTLLHVLEPAKSTWAGWAGSGRDTARQVEREVQRAQRRGGERLLTDVARRLPESLRSDAKIIEGHPAQAILDTASRGQSDLIVVGSRRRTTLGRILLGSVSSKVASHARCSVLVARRRS